MGERYLMPRYKEPVAGSAVGYQLYLKVEGLPGRGDLHGDGDSSMEHIPRPPPPGLWEAKDTGLGVVCWAAGPAWLPRVLPS